MPEPMMELGKDRPEGPASREADPRNTEQQAGLSGDNDADRIQHQPQDEAKKETDKAFIENSQGEGTATGNEGNVREAE